MRNHDKILAYYICKDEESLHGPRIVYFSNYRHLFFMTELAKNAVQLAGSNFLQ